MAINCSSNALLDTLNAKKEALNAKVAELQSLGAAAMADLQAKANDMKDALLAAVPEPPVLPNFKKELEELKGKVGAELAEAKAAFKERWGDALPDVDIDDLMDKVSGAVSLVQNFEEDLNDFVTGAVSNIAGAAGDALSGIAGAAEEKFDFCKDVPNIEAPEVSPEGKVEKVKVKAAEPTVAADIPKKVEEVVPTVVQKENEVSSSGLIEKSYSELLDDLAPYRKEIDELIKPFLPAIKKFSDNEKKMSRNKKYQKLVKKKAKSGLKTSEYYNTVASSAEKSLIEDKWQYWNEGKEAHLNKKLIFAYYTMHVRGQQAAIDGMEVLVAAQKADIRELGHVMHYNRNSFSNGVMTIIPAIADGMKWWPIVKEINSRYADAVAAFNNYKRR
jgi:hypothetical protein